MFRATTRPQIEECIPLCEVLPAVANSAGMGGLDFGTAVGLKANVGGSIFFVVLIC
jgi:hypothetical protein